MALHIPQLKHRLQELVLAFQILVSILEEPVLQQRIENMAYACPTEQHTSSRPDAPRCLEDERKATGRPRLWELGLGFPLLAHCPKYNTGFLRSFVLNYSKLHNTGINQM